MLRSCISYVYSYFNVFVWISYYVILLFHCLSKGWLCSTNASQAVADVELCLACVEGVYSGAQELSSLGGAGKKMGTVKTTMLKIEGVLYELVARSKSKL